MAAIDVRDLTKLHRQADAPVRVLDRVSLRVQAGEFVALTGRAGSGKTTLLRCMALLARPTTGAVEVDGVDATGLADGQRAELRGRRIGLVLRDRNLLPGLTAVENVLLPLRYAWLQRGARSRARELLDAVGLGDRAARRPDQLTRAEAQRVAIARALVRGPAVVLADEPTGELDDEAADELLDLMRQLNRSRDVTFVVATHDVEIASCLDRVVRLNEGRVVSDQRLRAEPVRLSGIR